MYVVQISTYVLPFLTIRYLSRILGVENYGLLAWAQWFTFYFITLTDYGFLLTATRHVAVHRDDKAELSRFYSAVMNSKLLLTAVGFVIMIAVTAAVPKLRSDWLLYLISFLSVGGTLFFPVWLLQGLQKLKQLALRDFFVKATATAAVFAFVLNNNHLLRAAAIQSGAPLLAGVLGLWMAQRMTGLRWRPSSWSDIRRALADSWPVFLSLAALTLFSSTNTFLLYLRTNAGDVAYFTNAQRIVTALRMLVTPLVTALYPYISRMAARSHKDATQFLERYSLLLASPFLLISVGLFVAAPWIVQVMFGPQYGPTVTLLRMLAISPFLLALSHSYATYYIMAFGHDKQWTRIVFQNLALNFLIYPPLLFLIRPIHAISIAMVVTDAYSLIASYWFYRRQTRSHTSAGRELRSGVELETH